MDVIKLTNVTKKFGDKTALNKINVSVGSGVIYGFLGPNGAGKTTTIRLLLDFIRPTSGNVKVFGKDVTEASSEIKRDIGYLSSDNTLYANWTGRDHIKFVESVRGKHPRAYSLAKELGLNLDAKYKQLSSGNKQKLALVLAIAHQPKLLILDEPTRGLDPILQNQIYELLRELRADGSTVFMSSHNLPEVSQVCDRVGIIRDGDMVRSESLADVRGLRTHIISAVLTDKVDAKKFARRGVEVVHASEHNVSLKVKGDISATIAELARHKLKDLEVTHASLEDVFMEYYKK